MQLKSPDSDLIYTFDWNNNIPAGESLQSVVHLVPAVFVKAGEQVDTAKGLSTVRVSGGAHGDIGEITALASISTGEQIPGAFTLRVMYAT